MLSAQRLQCSKQGRSANCGRLFGVMDTWAQSEVADATSDVLIFRIIKVPIDHLYTAWTQVRDTPMRLSTMNVLSASCALQWLLL